MRELLPQELLERDRGGGRAPQRIPVSAPGLYSAGKEAAALAGIGRPSIEAVRLRQRTVCSGYFKHPSASHVRRCRPVNRRYSQSSHGPSRSQSSNVASSFFHFSCAFISRNFFPHPSEFSGLRTSRLNAGGGIAELDDLGSFMFRYKQAASLDTTDERQELPV